MIEDVRTAYVRMGWLRQQEYYVRCIRIMYSACKKLDMKLLQPGVEGQVRRRINRGVVPVPDGLWEGRAGIC